MDKLFEPKVAGRLCRTVLIVLCVVLPVLSCQKDPVMHTTLESIVSDYPGGEYTISIDSNVPWKVYANYQVGSEKGWIHFDNTEGESGVSQLVVYVDPSSHYTREGHVVFELEKNAIYHSVQVHQQGKLDREMSDLFSPAFWDYIMKKELIHQALEQDRGKVWFYNILNVKKLDLSGETFDFMADLAYFEQLEELSVSGCGLTEFTTFMPGLKKLNCEHNRLTRLDPELFPSLSKLYCMDNQITEIDPEAWPSLAILQCPSNPLLTIDVSSTTRLNTLHCYDTPIAELVIGPSIEMLVCGDSELERVDLSRATNLYSFNCNESAVKELDFSNTNVSGIYCSRNPELQTLILPKKQQIRDLVATSNRITGDLTVSSEKIESVLLENNQINRLRFTESAAPEYVCVANNRIEELVLPNTSNLYELDCKNNLLAEVGVLPQRIRWPLLSLTGNPGKDGVFTVYVYEDVDMYYPQSYIPASWAWNGSKVVTQVVRVPR